jgi:glutaredoxin-like protein
MALIGEKDAALIREQFAQEIQRPVKLAVFTTAKSCMYCKETRQIAEELASLSDLLSLDVHDIDADSELAGQLGVDKTPAIVVMAKDEGDADYTDYGIRFYGIPSGYEFMSLIDAIQTVGSGSLDLSGETLAFLESLEEDVHIQVFVTPTCPYCPRAVILAHHLAYASERVTADMVEATEFPELSARYSVMGVPRSIINEDIHQEGAVPEPMFLARLKEAVAA